MRSTADLNQGKEHLSQQLKEIRSISYLVFQEMCRKGYTVEKESHLHGETQQDIKRTSYLGYPDS